MSATLNSPTWYRVAYTRPKLGHNVSVQRQVFRGRVWYVLQDRSSGRFHRYPPQLHAVLARMDGAHTVQQIWLAVLEHLGADAPSQSDVIRFLADLHRTDALVTDARPNHALQAYRRRASWRQRLKQRLANPVALRLPLVDPDAFLSKLSRTLSPLLGWAGALLWLAVVGWGLVLTVIHWSRLVNNGFDTAFELDNLLLTLLVFPLVKVLHEIAHGVITRHYGGEVHEAGVMLLLFVPVPYIECSAASAFPERRRRMLVGAAGILADLFMGALALMVWLQMEPGMARSLCFNVVLVTWASTLLFNGNPLLRYDGYYVLADALEMPNLGQTANRYYAYLAQRYLLGIPERENPARDRRESWIFGLYGVAAFAYRLVLALAIALTLVSYLFQLGMLLALWVLVSMLGLPAWRALKFLFDSPLLETRRWRVLGVLALCLSALALLLAAMPLSSRTEHDGVVTAFDASVVRAQSEGLVTELLARPDAPVAASQLLVQLDNPEARARLAVAQGQVLEMQARLAQAQVEGRAQTRLWEERLVQAMGESVYFEQEVAQLQVLSPSEGIFVPERTVDLPGSFIARGQALGYVLNPQHLGLKVIVSQQDARRLLEAGAKADIRSLVRSVDRPGEPLLARVVRAVPAATDELPDASLSVRGGGAVGVDPTRTDTMRSVEKLFVVYLSFQPGQASLPRPGMRVRVWLQHAPQPLGVELRDGLLRLWVRLTGH
jgi:putative peptide zinc metalloprotease protein